ncbi:MAG: hypothetical protein WBQ25_21790 [Nitrososphaeraceae archaeon]
MQLVKEAGSDGIPSIPSQSNSCPNSRNIPCRHSLHVDMSIPFSGLASVEEWKEWN